MTSISLDFLILSFFLAFLCAQFLYILILDSGSAKIIFKEIRNYSIDLTNLISLSIALLYMFYGIWGLLINANVGQFLVFFWASSTILNAVESDKQNK
jgi:hypothetical protein